MGRFYLCPKTGLKKGAWTRDEDQLLAAYVKRYGHCNWRELPKYAGLSRCGKSCRLRWLNYLRPTIRRGNYTREKDELIIKLHEKLGNKWSIIAASLPGRTDNEVKNHWHCHLKKHTEHNKNHWQNQNKVNSATPQMIESSVWVQVSPANSSECSPSMIAPEVESPISLEAAFEFDADFWSEPFLMDNFYKPGEPSLVFSPSPLGEALYPYNFYDGFDMDTLLNT